METLTMMTNNMNKKYMRGEVDGVVSCFLVFVILIVFLVCNDMDYSSPWEHQAAAVACKNNGGYKRYGYTYSFARARYTVFCNDGAEFKYEYPHDLKSLIEDTTESKKPSK
jgi:hypothetical protein